jgi:hypothetical protein
MATIYVAPMIRSLGQIDAATLQHWRRNPDQFIEQVLISPYNGRPYVLVDAERQFIKHFFQLDSDGRLLYPLGLFGAIKKSRKSELGALILITMVLLFGGTFSESFICGSGQEAAAARVFTTAQRVIEASPLICGEAEFTQTEIRFPATRSTITALPVSPSGIAGSHPCLSIFDEAWTILSNKSKELYYQLQPVPTRPISARLLLSHGGYADDDSLLYSLYKRGMQLPEIAPNLHGGDGFLMYWSHEPLHPEWQTQKWVEEARRELPAAQFMRMFENKFTAGETNFVTAEMYDRCVKLEGPPPSDPKLQIIAAVDAAVKRDNAAVIAVSIEHDVVSLVHDAIYQPSPDDPLDFESTIERTLIELSKRYYLRVVVYDEHQMVAVAQHLRRLGLRLEEFPQTPANLISMSQSLFDLIRTGRLKVYPSKALRESVLATVAKEGGGGLKITKDRTAGSKPTDATTALAMACHAAVQGMSKPRYRWDVWDMNFRDEDLPPEPPPPDPGPMRSLGDWWKLQPQYSQPTSTVTADDRLLAFYKAIDAACRIGPSFGHSYGRIDNRDVLFRHTISPLRK